MTTNPSNLPEAVPGGNHLPPTLPPTCVLVAGGPPDNPGGQGAIPIYGLPRCIKAIKRQLSEHNIGAFLRKVGSELDADPTDVLEDGTREWAFVFESYKCRVQQEVSGDVWIVDFRRKPKDGDDDPKGPNGPKPGRFRRAIKKLWSSAFSLALKPAAQEAIKVVVKRTLGDSHYHTESTFDSGVIVCDEHGVFVPVERRWTKQPSWTIEPTYIGRGLNSRFRIVVVENDAVEGGSNFSTTVTVVGMSGRAIEFSALDFENARELAFALLLERFRTAALLRAASRDRFFSYYFGNADDAAQRELRLQQELNAIDRVLGHLHGDKYEYYVRTQSNRSRANNGSASYQAKHSRVNNGSANSQVNRSRVNNHDLVHNGMANYKAKHICGNNGNANDKDDGNGIPRERGIYKGAVAAMAPVKKAPAFTTPAVPDVDVYLIRRTLGDSPQEFANRLGVSVDQVIAWECHEGELNPALRKILGYLESDPDEVTRDLAAIRSGD